MSRESIRALYWIETGVNLEEAARTMAGEQTSGTFTRLEAESETLISRHRGEVVSIREVGEALSPSLPGAARAGLDFIKDDELIANPPYSPVKERVTRVMQAIRDHDARETGRLMYAVNISDTPEAMQNHHEEVLATGGNCVMVNLISVGLAGVLSLRKNCALPIHGHRNGWGALSRCSALGFDYRAWHKLWKLAGVDQLHVNGLRNKFCESDDSVIASAKTVQSPLGPQKPAIPVFSSGQWVGQVEDTYHRLGNADLLFVCGGGIWAHPDGAEAGVRALRKAWQGVISGLSLNSLCDQYPEIRSAFMKFNSSR